MNKINNKELKQLFENIRNNSNKETIEELYKKYRHIIYSIAFSILKNKEDSEDIVQNVIIKIQELDKDKLPTDNEASWLYTVTKNETLSFIKKKNREINTENMYEIEEQNDEINKMIDKENFNQLICTLNKKEKEIVSLKIISDLSFKEIGHLLDEPVSTVKWRYYKSIYKVKSLLSNFTMFIITFVIGLFTMRNGSKKAQQEISDIIDDEENDIIEKPAERNDIIIEDSEKEEIKENTINQEVIIEEVVESTNINYLGISILSISTIFLIITIVIAIFFKKYQLKIKVKSSK